MALDRLTQITSSGISSTAPLLGINITGVITATSITATNYGSVNATSLNVSGVSTLGSGATVFGVLQTQGLQVNSGVATIKSPGASTTFLNALNSNNTPICRLTQTTGGSSYLELRESIDRTFMVIDSANNFVGIGTSIPDSILYVGYGPDSITNGYANSRLVVNDSGNRQADIFARNHVDDVMCRMTAGQTTVQYGAITNHPVDFLINNNSVIRIDTSGNLIPFSDNTYNLGSSSYRWANIYSADLQLSNEGSQNDVDGTWGNYTIQEGENDLFLINRRTGKKYKFLLEEIK